MEEIVKCPICKRRIFDLEWRDRTRVVTKCRHCNNVVTILKEAPVNARGDPEKQFIPSDL